MRVTNILLQLVLATSGPDKFFALYNRKTKIMNTLRLALLCVLLNTIVSGDLLAQRAKTSTVKVFVSENEIIRGQAIAMLEIDHFTTSADGAIISQVGQREMQVLRQSGLKYEVLVDDVAEDLRKKNADYELKKASGRLAFEQPKSTIDAIIPTPSAFQVKTGFGGYYRYAEMIAAVDALVAAYPNLASKINLTPTAAKRTVGNREIWAVKISDNVGTDETSEPEVLYIGLQHAREAIGGASMIFFMQYLCENYATDARVKNLVDNRQIYIVPCMNPDGWEYNYTLDNDGGGDWRKNRNGNGVDLNRNWGVNWGNCSSPIQGNASSCGSSNSTSGTYYGTAAFSERETQAIRDFTYQRRFVAMIDQHAYGPYYSLPFGRPSLPTNVMDPYDKKFYTHVSSAMGVYNGMRAGDSYQALKYEVAGGVKDWMLKGNIGTNGKTKIFGMTGEGGAGGGASGTIASFWPPKDQIINLCKGMIFQNLQLLIMAGTYARLQDKTNMVVSTKTGSFAFDAARYGIGNGDITVSLVPVQNIASVGTPVTIGAGTLANYGDMYNGSINYTLPASLSSGQQIKFAWKVESQGVTILDTIIKYYHTTPASMVLFEDDMEGTFSNNWISASTYRNSSNQNVADENWAYTTNDKFAGSRSLTESPAGNYRANTTRILVYKGRLDISNATAAHISFWVKHKAENFHDKLQVQVSTDSVTWVPIAGKYTIQEPGTIDGSTIDGQPALTGIREDWTKEMFDLTNYLGQSQLRVRLVFTSDSTPGDTFSFKEDDGFYIDNFVILKSTVPLKTLPVEFLSVAAALLSNQTAEVKWEAIVDNKHSYFEVEKSTDGLTFTPIGVVKNNPFVFIDPSPVTGINIYRIKQYDIDGKFSYSKNVSVNKAPTTFKISTFPNPVTDMLNIRVVTPVPEKLLLQVTDISGKMVYVKTDVAGNNGTISFNIKELPANIYILRLVNKDNKIVATEKFVKQ